MPRREATAVSACMNPDAGSLRDFEARATQKRRALASRTVVEHSYRTGSKRRGGKGKAARTPTSNSDGLTTRGPRHQTVLHAAPDSVALKEPSTMSWNRLSDAAPKTHIHAVDTSTLTASPSRSPARRHLRTLCGHG